MDRLQWLERLESPEDETSGVPISPTQHEQLLGLFDPLLLHGNGSPNSHGDIALDISVSYLVRAFLHPILPDPIVWRHQGPGTHSAYITKGRRSRSTQQSRIKFFQPTPVSIMSATDPTQMEDILLLQRALKAAGTDSAYLTRARRGSTQLSWSEKTNTYEHKRRESETPRRRFRRWMVIKISH